MNRVNFGRVSGTVVDVCKGHGTLLDSGELNQIVAFIRAGGLERARQRQIEDLKEEERRLRQLQAGRHADAGNETIAGAPHTWSGFDLLSLLEHLK